MRNLLLLSIIVLLFAGCRKIPKDTADYYPEVKVLDVTVQPDGSVTVRGQVLAEGASELMYAGFCMDTQPMPELLSGQLLATEVEGNIFSCTYTDIKGVGKHYFRAFAANKDGYSYSDQQVLTGGGIDTSIVPCTPGFNTLQLESMWGLQSEIFYPRPASQNGVGWSLHVSANTKTILFEFGSRPQGILTTAGNYTPGKGEVRIMVSGDAVAADAKVYIKELSDTSFDLWLCDAEILDGNNTKISLRLRSTY